MLDLLDSGKLTLGLGDVVRRSRPAGVERFIADVGAYKGRILLRSEEISNHPELVRRLGVIAINGMIEADIYGNVNSTHVMGSRIMNGIGGSGDFARNAFLQLLRLALDGQGRGDLLRSCRWSATSTTPSTTCRCSITEQGDGRPARAGSPATGPTAIIDALRAPGLPRPARRLRRPAPRPPGRTRGTPRTCCDEALGWHARFLETGQM